MDSFICSHWTVQVDPQIKNWHPDSAKLFDRGGSNKTDGFSSSYNDNLRHVNHKNEQNW